MNVQDQTRALLRADEAAVLRAVADYIAASYTPEQEARQDVRRAIEGHLGATQPEPGKHGRLSASDQITLLSVFVLTEMPGVARDGEQVSDTLLRVLPTMLQEAFLWRELNASISADEMRRYREKFGEPPGGDDGQT